jgi:hypothetical protein
MQVLRLIIILIIFMALSGLYKKLKLNDDMTTNQYYHKMIDKYLLNKNALGMGNKPILWIYVHNDSPVIPEVNSRFWLNFGSRATKNFNQPYQYLTIKSIIDKCGSDFNICLIDDAAFKVLLPNWSINLQTIAIPMRVRVRLLGLASLINVYGGMLVPSSFICFQSLKDLYETCVTSNKIFVAQFQNRTCNEALQSQVVAPTPFFMGGKAGSETMSEFIHYLEIVNSKDFTAQADFLGVINQWLANAINQEKIISLDGTLIGTQKIDGRPIYVEELVGSTFIDLHPESLGLYIPWNELINRTSLQWFVRLSPEQVLTSNTVIGKHLLINN